MGPRADCVLPECGLVPRAPGGKLQRVIPIVFLGRPVDVRTHLHG